MENNRKIDKERIPTEEEMQQFAKIITPTFRWYRICFILFIVIFFVGWFFGQMSVINKVNEEIQKKFVEYFKDVKTEIECKK